MAQKTQSKNTKKNQSKITKKNQLAIPSELRSVLSLRMRGKKYREIHEVTGLSISTISDWIRRYLYGKFSPSKKPKKRVYKPVISDRSERELIRYVTANP